MKPFRLFAIVFAVLSALTMMACKKNDESKPTPQLVSQGKGQSNEVPPKKDEEGKVTPQLVPQGQGQSKDTPPKKEVKKEESKKEERKQEGAGKPAASKKLTLDQSKAKLVSLSNDEFAFLYKIFNAKFESEFRTKNINIIQGSDLGLLSSAKLKKVDHEKTTAEIRLHLVSEDRIVTFLGEFSGANVFSLKSKDSDIQLRALCADDQCDMLIGYASALRGEQGSQVKKENMIGTFIFMRSGDEYLSVQPKSQQTAEEKENFAVIKVEKNLLEGIEKYGGKIVSDLQEKIKQEDAWYSPFPFLINLISERTDLVLQESGAQLDETNYTFELKQMFNAESDTTRLKNYALNFAGKIGAPVVAKEVSQDIEVTWTMLTKKFGYGVFKTTQYISNRDLEKKKRTAYFIKWCGFEGITVNKVTVQIDKCDYKASTEFLGSKNEKGELESGPAEGGLN